MKTTLLKYRDSLFPKKMIRLNTVSLLCFIHVNRITYAESNSTNYRPVVTPNGSTLPYKMVDGVKEFHLIANTVKREFTPGFMVDCWGYKGQSITRPYYGSCTGRPSTNPRHQ